MANNDKLFVKATIGPVRLSYPALFEPKRIDESDDKKIYSASFLFPKTDDKLSKALLDAIKEVIPANAPKTLNGQLDQTKFRIPVRDGAEKEDDPNYAGMYFLNAKSDEAHKPAVLKKVDGVFVPATADDIYPGCWVYANIGLTNYDKNGNRGVRAVLIAVLKYRDDASFAATFNAETAFGGIDIPEPAPADMPDNLGGFGI